MSNYREQAALLLESAPQGTEVRIQYVKGTAQIVVRCGREECVTSIPEGRGLEEGICLALKVMAKLGSG